MSVSIGIPFYNPGDALLDAIKSVFAQDYQAWELILVDDGSSDKSLEIAKSINDRRVRVISDGSNLRLPARLNQIAREAKYDIVVRMDADDLMHPQRISKQLAYLSRHPEKDLVAAGMYSITDDGDLAGVRNPSDTEEILLSLPNLVHGRCTIIHPTIMARKSWFLRNPYDETALLMEDYQLWIDAYARNDFNIGFISESLLFYRYSGSISKVKSITAYKNQMRLVNERYRSRLTLADILGFILKTRIKIMIVWLLDSLGMERALHKIRHLGTERENLAEKQRCTNILASIRQTVLPRKNQL